MMDSNTTLILGGARSGKSFFAEKLARNQNLELIYIATGEARDDEMSERIKHHQAQRGTEWKTIEEPVNISDVIQSESNAKSVILIDCLTLWLSNLIEKKLNIETEVDKFIKEIKQARGPIIIVSNEVGQGIVPNNPLARIFRDEAGRLNQKIAAVAVNVYFITAGLPMPLKENNQLLTKKFN